jgi:hypothetical protein
MKKIKIAGAFIFIFSIVLAVLFNYTSKNNQIHTKLLETIKEQKAFTQEISKHIFYIYKNQNTSTKTLDKAIKKYLDSMNKKNRQLYKNDKIIKLWNEFYLHVQHFRDQIKVRSAYSNLLLEKNVNDIYSTNLKLILEFDKLIKDKEENFNAKHTLIITIQYILFSTLVLLLLYIFTQLRSLVDFIQEFLFKSKKIINNSSIKELEPIELVDKNIDISEAENNFNTLVLKINNSVKNSSISIEHAHKSIEMLDLHVEEMLDFIYEMNKEKPDEDMRKKEDIIIQSLEELSSCSAKLKNLKKDLDSLTSP